MPEQPDKPDVKEETVEPSPSPAWDLMIDVINAEFCDLHEAQKKPHNVDLQIAQVTTFMGALMLGIQFHQDHSFDAEVLLNEYLARIKDVKAQDTTVAGFASVVRAAHMGDPAGR